MAERYRRLFSIDKPLYLEGSPVSIEAGALLLDNELGRVLAQVKFKNLSEKRIISVTAEIQPYDVIGRRSGDAVKHMYLDLSENTLFEFGSKVPVYLPDSTSRRFDVKVTEVIFYTGELWSNDAPFEDLKPLVELKGVIGGSEMVKQYAIETGRKGIYLPERYKDLSYCSCGAIYKSSIRKCPNCGKSLDFLIEKLDKNILKQKMNERLEREHREAEERRLKAEERKRKTIKAAAIGVPSVAAIVIFIVLLNTLILPAVAYNKAEKLAAEQNYTEAVSEYLKAKDFSDAKDKTNELLYKLGARETLSAGGNHTVALTNDGTVIAVGDNDDKQCDVSNWRDIAAVSAGYRHTVGLKNDGTVVAAGYNKREQCNIGDWMDIIAVSTGYYHTLGLKKDGTVVAAGDNSKGQCNVGDWKDIVAVAGGGYHTVGLKKDGTVVAVGDNGKGQCNVGDWTDITSISAGDGQTLGLKKDGTVAAVGDNSEGQCNVGDWTEITSLITKYGHTVGIRKDGTAVAVGNNRNGQCYVAEWTDLAAVSSGYYHTVGLKKDGTVFAVGSNYEKQCNVGKWIGIKIP